MEPRINADEKTMMHADEITRRIIGCAYTVSNALGCGFLEKVYENALAHGLRKAALLTEQQRDIEVHNDGVRVGSYCADLLVEHEILVELKTAVNLESIHLAQCLNYLKATDLKLALLINFGTPKIQVKRVANGV
jgi:GxxExxY protein